LCQITAGLRKTTGSWRRGDKIAEIANALEISYKTVANTTSLLKQKLGAKTHSDLIRIAVEMGMD
jgi:DNA-binding CsgD family transcriptional regulator